MCRTLRNCENIYKILVLLSPVILASDLILKVYYASRLHLKQCSTKEQKQAKIAARRKDVVPSTVKEGET